MTDSSFHLPSSGPGRHYVRSCRNVRRRELSLSAVGGSGGGGSGKARTGFLSHDQQVYLSKLDGICARLIERATVGRLTLAGGRVCRIGGEFTDHSTRRRAAADRRAHNAEVAGANPAGAIDRRSRHGARGAT
jgi:hypothetical protein